MPDDRQPPPPGRRPARRGPPPPPGGRRPPPPGSRPPPPGGRRPASSAGANRRAAPPPRPRPTRPPVPRNVPRGRRFSLVRVGAPPIHLIEGRDFVVGRSNEADLTVPSQRVSRRHAEIGWANGKPVLRDLGSQNGTLVNGKRIKAEHSLQDGDELEFGPYMCTYRTGAAAAPAGPDNNALTQPMVGDAMAGRLDQINLSELLQTLEFNQKTGTLEIFGSDGEGFIVIQSGRPTFAQAEGHQGEEAVYALIKYRNGQFSFSADVTEKSKNIDKPMGSLLMEAMRRLDEG